MPGTIGCHLAKSAYGLRLPGNDRGSWSEACDDQIGFHTPHTLHQGDPVRQRIAEERMKHPPVRFDQPMMNAITQSLCNCIQKSNGGLTITTLAIEETNMHLALRYTWRDIDNTAKWLADQTTKAVHRHTDHTGPVWAKGNWRSSIYEGGIWAQVDNLHQKPQASPCRRAWTYGLHPREWGRRGQSCFNLGFTAHFASRVVPFSDFLGIPEPAATSRSLRTAVIGLVSDFANRQDITCGLTHQAIAEMVFSLAAYREEEIPLFPEVYVILSSDTMKLLSAVPQSLELGTGPQHPVTVSNALKTCAPLACDGWAMFLRRYEGGFSFGVFRSRESVLALSASEQMLSSVDVGAPALLLRHSKSNCVELVGRRGERLEVRLTSEPDGPTLDKPPWFNLAERLSQGVTDQNLKEIVRREFIANISAACRGSHGTMIALISATEAKVPVAFRDGVLLSEPIDVVGLIERTHSSKDMASMNELISAQALIRGMIRSDGITLMDLKGKTLGFRVFVKAKPEEHVGTVTGGARSRAFELLKLRVGHELDSAMLWSQDGRSEFVGGAA